MAPWNGSCWLPCLSGISPITRQISLRKGSQSWVRHGIPQRARSESQHSLNRHLLTARLTQVVIVSQTDTALNPCPHSSWGNIRTVLFLHNMPRQERTRGCEIIHPDNLGQSGDSQDGSGRERKSISGRRNSILKDEREGEGERI